MDYYYGSSSGGGRNASASSSGSIKYVFTWVPDDLTDTPPQKVWVNESASANWEAHIDGAQWHSMTGQPCPIDTSFSGSASDGLGGIYVPDAPTGDFGVMGGHCESSKLTEVAGGYSFSRTCSPSATASASGGQYWRGGVTVSVGYSVNIIATPYDFRVDREAIANDNAGDLYGPYPKLGEVGGGQLLIPYKWKSTTGYIQDLYDVKIYEVVAYSGDGQDEDNFWTGKRWFVPLRFPFLDSGGKPDAPTSWAEVNPFNSKEEGYPTWGSNGRLLDSHSRGGKLFVPISGVPISGKTYFAYEGVQDWLFDCPAANIVGKKVPSPTGESGLNTIRREYYKLTSAEDNCPCFNGQEAWRYKTTKHDFVSWSDWIYNSFGGGEGDMIRDSVYGTYP